MIQGNAERAAAEGEARQLEDRARAERAAGTYNADRIRQRAKEILSTQRARMAASGGGAGVDDPTAMAVQGETVKRASMEQLLLMAQAEDEARQDEYAAVLTRQRGKAEQRASRYVAASRLLDAGAQAWGARGGDGKGGNASKSGKN